MKPKTKVYVDLNLPTKLVELAKDKSRHKVLYGGRGSAKSWSVAACLISFSMNQKKRILCAREYQKSINDSVYKLLADTIHRMGFDAYFTITQKEIRNVWGSQFIFEGLHNNIGEIKSKEGIDYCWVEEAQKVSKMSWQELIPTIRKDNSEIWITFNPDTENDETYQRFIVHTPPDTFLRKINHDDNPFFPEVLKKEMEWDKKTNYEKYMHVWEGAVLSHSEAQIFKGKWIVEAFETPLVQDLYQNRFFYGADWGFSADPSVLIRCFIQNRKLYIDWESYGIGVEIPELPQLFNKVPESRLWNIKADCSRPETISYMASQGFNIEAAPKWSGSVEDGIEYIKGFEQIIIHPRCIHTIEESKFYSYKVDKNTDEILPVVLDKHNHIYDSLRYSLSDYIKHEVSIYDAI